MNDTQHPAGHVLQAYHDGELEPSATALVETHVKECAHCRDELADLARVDQLLVEVPMPELSGSMWPRVRPGRASQVRLRPALGLAACALGIVLGVLLGPLEFGGRRVPTNQDWSKPATVWSAGASTSLLDVFQYGQE